MKDLVRSFAALVVAALLFAGCEGNITAPLSPEAEISESAAVSQQNCTITVPGDHSSIQGAVDAASAGDNVCVDPGTYGENVSIDKMNLTLYGPNAGVRGDDEDRGPEATIEGQVVLSADGTTLDGFDVSPPPAQTNAEGEAVRIEGASDGVTVTNNVVRDFEEDGVPQWEGIEGIAVFGGDESDPITDVTITRNEVKRIEGRDEAGGAAGIMIQGNVASATVEDNVVFDIGQEATAWAHGVVVTGTGNHKEVPAVVEIAYNDLSSILADPASETDGVGVGIESDGTDYRITENAIAGNNIGVEVKAAADNTVVDFNDFTDNAVGVLNQGGIANVTENNFEIPDDITDQWFHVYFTGGAEGKIADNEMSGAHRVGILIDGEDTDAEVRANKVVGTGPKQSGWAENGIQVSRGATAEVTNNNVESHWWEGANWAASGMLVVDTEDVEVRSNTVKDNEIGIGIISFSESAPTKKNVLERNTLRGGAFGIALQAVAEGKVKSNNVFNNTLNSRDGLIGISSSEFDEDAKVKNNTIERNRIHGYDQAFSDVDDDEGNVVTPVGSSGN